MSLLEFDNKIGYRARMWLDDLPHDALLPNDTVCEPHVFDAGTTAALWSRIAIEIFQPRGARFFYGLLGGEYRPTSKGVLELIIPLDVSSTGRLYVNSLAHSLDTVRTGGLPEYTGAICAGVRQMDINARPSGILNLTCMAHGEIGSAPIMFSSLARALVRTLCRLDQPTSLDDVMVLLAA